jgi:hypothetical protein
MPENLRKIFIFKWETHYLRVADLFNRMPANSQTPLGAVKSQQDQPNHIRRGLLVMTGNYCEELRCSSSSVIANYQVANQMFLPVPVQFRFL